MLEESNSLIKLEEVLDSEIDDIWDIFFPYMKEKNEKVLKLNQTEKEKPRRYLKFLSI